MLRVQNHPMGAEFEHASEVSKCHSGINPGIPSQSASSGDLPFPAGHAENKTTAIQPLGALPRTSPFPNPQVVTEILWHGCAQTGDTQGPMPGTLSTPDPLGLRLHHRSPSQVPISCPPSAVPGKKQDGLPTTGWEAAGLSPCVAPPRPISFGTAPSQPLASFALWGHRFLRWRRLCCLPVLP